MPGIGRESPRKAPKEHQIGEKSKQAHTKAEPYKECVETRPKNRAEGPKMFIIMCSGPGKGEKEELLLWGLGRNGGRSLLNFLLPLPVFLPSSALVGGLFQQPIFNKSLSTKQQKIALPSKHGSIVSAGETARKQHFCRCWKRRLSMLIPLTQHKNVLDKRLSGC
ncbi:hypothetical protein DdX_13352 [Ditylenchus destructor]|uniref:Uncharacterized protein n=1 Tax=Ditylenchus destructor TaxID=166010 RepID=A0AAD4R2Q0_9BILA|nr:hypothetical protein DdX_13352 [Ditylenchus destructor]